MSVESPPENLEYWLKILMAVALVAWVISGAFLIVEGITSGRGIGLLSNNFFVAADLIAFRVWVASSVGLAVSYLARISRRDSL